MNDPASRGCSPSPDYVTQQPSRANQEYPDLEMFRYFFARGQVCSPKRLWYSSWTTIVFSIVVFGISLGVKGYYIHSVAGDLGISSGVLGVGAAIGGIVAVLINKGGNPVYTNVLHCYFIIVSLLSLAVPIASLVALFTDSYWVRDEVIALLVFSIVHAGLMIFTTVQVKERSEMRYLSFGGSDRGVDSSRMQNMAAFISRWNERDTGCLNLETPAKINKNLKSERCLLWTLVLYQLLCGLMLIGLGIFNLIENKATVVAISFAPFWNGPISILCSLIGFMALNRKTSGLGVAFLASSFLTFGVAVAFLVYVCIDVDETIRCMQQTSWCSDYITHRDLLLFSLTYAGFGLFLLFQLVFSFIGIVLLFYTVCSCCRREDRRMDDNAPPSYVESTPNFDPMHQRY